MMKKIISILLCLAMLISVAGISVSASEEEIKTPAGNVETLFRYLKMGINDTKVYMKDTDNPDVDEFYISYSNNNGETFEQALGTYYNCVTGEVSGFNYEAGIFDLGFAYNAHSKVFYATNGCWQRKFGFTPVYDLLAKLAFDYTTERIFFDYGGKAWMVQIWKGNYAFDIFVGGEVGLYNRPEGSLGMFYNCAALDEMVPMSMRIYSAEKEYFNREEYLTWWATGFIMSDPVDDPETLSMDFTIDFQNKEMCDAFEKAIADKDFSKCERVENKMIITW